MRWDGSGEHGTASTTRTNVWSRTKQFIAKHLAPPGASDRGIFAASAVSDPNSPTSHVVSPLQHIFQEIGLTVGKDQSLESLNLPNQPSGIRPESQFGGASMNFSVNAGPSVLRRASTLGFTDSRMSEGRRGLGSLL